MHKDPYGGLPGGIFYVVSYAARTGLAARGSKRGLSQVAQRLVEQDTVLIIVA